MPKIVSFPCYWASPISNTHSNADAPPLISTPVQLTFNLLENAQQLMGNYLAFPVCSLGIADPHSQVGPIPWSLCCSHFHV